AECREQFDRGVADEIDVVVVEARGALDVARVAGIEIVENHLPRIDHCHRRQLYESPVAILGSCSRKDHVIESFLISSSSMLRRRSAVPDARNTHATQVRCFNMLVTSRSSVCSMASNVSKNCWIVAMRPLRKV